jgi:hypothetical protein
MLMMKRVGIRLGLTGIILLVSAAVWGQGLDSQDGCIRCHRGIESIGEPHRELGCDDCHFGDLSGTTKETAHQGMVKNPGDLAIAEQTCGVCHGVILEKMKKSLHSTSAGIISGARYQWAAQESKHSLYSVREVEDNDGDIPEEWGAVRKLETLPHYAESGQPVDDYLRNQCLRCHLWTEGARRAGDYRGSGCSACHVLYADDGLSRTGDPTIPNDEPGHPIKHEITTKIPAVQCVHCHNRGGRTGVSYLGMMESDGYGTPYTPEGGKQSKLHGKYYNYLQEDVHLEKGMQCIDCHTVNDIHGDGNLYGKKEQAVEIECTDCHGTLDEYSNLKTSRNRPLSNLIQRGNQVILKGKMDGREHRVPQVRGLKERSSLPAAMRISGHMKKLECYACHARWAPQCYGCHTKMDMRGKGFDWVDSQQSGTFRWEESRSYLRWETPALGINAEGKVSPFVPGCQAIFNRTDEEGNPVETNKVFTNAEGHSGLAHNPIQPHTVTRQARTCENCHSNRKALGLGSGHYISRYNGLDLPFELERIVDEDGRQIQGTSHVGARPFNKEELEKIQRSNACLGCHQETPTALWKKVIEKWGKVDNNAAHQDLLNEILLETADETTP